MKRTSTLILTVFVLAMMPIMGTAQTTDALFQQAQRMERVQGDYQGAIGVYEQIVGSSSVDRSSIARALVQMGKAYESLGRTEAAQIYDRVLAEFSDLTDSASEARAGIIRTRPSSLALVSVHLPLSKTLIETNGNLDAWGSSLSPSGRFYIGANNDTHNIIYVDVETGDRQVLNTGEGGYNQFPRFSPDERMVAYAGYDSDDRLDDIRIIDTTDGVSRTVLDVEDYFRRYENMALTRSSTNVLDWNENGSELLVFLYGSSDVDVPAGERLFTGRLLLLPVDGSEPRVVSEDPSVHEWVDRACMTAGNRYIMAQHWEGDPSRENIVRIDVKTGKTALWRHSDTASFNLIGCPTKSGKVLYESSVLGNKAIYAGEINVLGHGDVDLFLDSMPQNAWAVPSSDNGDVVVINGSASFSLSVNDLDPETSEIIGSRQLGESRWVYLGPWSPDGKEITWRTLDNEVVIWNSKTGSERRFKIAAARGNTPPQWLPDGKRLLVQGARRTDSTFINIFDAVNGELLRRFETLGARVATPGPDGQSVITGDNKEGCFTQIDLRSKISRDFVCVEGAPFIYNFIQNGPDYSNYVITSITEDSTFIVRTVNSDGSDLKVVFENDSVEKTMRLPQWGSSDELLFSQSDPESKRRTWSITKMNLRSGRETSVFEKLTSRVQVRSFKLSSDGLQLALLSAPLDGFTSKHVTIIHNVLGLTK